jgi:nucleotide-binding universal stress UspA family protein
LLEGVATALRSEGLQDVTVSVCSGNPTDEILRHSARASADMIVMGTHGRTGVARFLLGSIAAGVMRGASCPVVTAHAAHSE